MRSVAVVVALAACLHAGVWALLETRQVAPDVNKPLASVSYDSRPGGKDTRPTIEQMRADFRALAPYTRTIRTYASTDSKLPVSADDPPVHSDWESLPAVAAEFGLKVTLGIWLELDAKSGRDSTPRETEKRGRGTQRARDPRRHRACPSAQ